MTGIRIAVVGGGRWARVYARVLMSYHQRLASVAIVSPRNAAAMRDWVKQESWPTGPNISVVGQIPGAGIDCAIVVNEAAQHEASAATLLRAGIPVLVEKPLALSGKGVRRLIELATEHKTIVAAALVLRYASYLENFRHVLATYPVPRRINITWCDAAGENRYGERKSYDARLSVVADVLPHIASILHTLWPQESALCMSVGVERGGADVSLSLILGAVPCQVLLSRNAPTRARRIEVDYGAGVASLNFSPEPGEITCGGESRSAAPDWANALSPLTQLIGSFLDCAASDHRGAAGCDRRLDVDLARRAAELTDSVVARYDEALLAWLRKEAREGTLTQQDIAYASAESADDRNSADVTSDVAALISRIEERAHTRLER